MHINRILSDLEIKEIVVNEFINYTTKLETKRIK